jgi:ribosome recycling factor
MTKPDTPHPSVDEARRQLRTVMNEAKQHMQGAIDALDHDLGGYRTGRASTALIERIQVPYYGTPTPLAQLATLSAPEPRLLAIQVWDRNAVSQVEKAILASDLGLTPHIDGQLIRLPIPVLTEERRADLVKMVARRLEEARVAVRNVRRDLLHDVDRLELPEDEVRRARDAVQELTDTYVALAEGHGERKTAEIREV